MGIKKFKFGIIDERKDSIILFNDWSKHPKFFMSMSTQLVDVNVEFTDKGFLVIRAKRIEYDLYISFHNDKYFEEDWVRQPDKNYIKEGKRHFWSTKKEKYVESGWVKAEETTPITYVLNKYKVEILDV